MHEEIIKAIFDQSIQSKLKDTKCPKTVETKILCFIVMSTIAHILESRQVPLLIVDTGPPEIINTSRIEKFAKKVGIHAIMAYPNENEQSTEGKNYLHVVQEMKNNVSAVTECNDMEINFPNEREDTMIGAQSVIPLNGAFSVSYTEVLSRISGKKLRMTKTASSSGIAVAPNG